MPLPFNKILDQKLIKLVRDNPALYHPKHPNYMDFDAREVAWQKIGDSLNRSAMVCKSRWINIRDMMRRKMKDRLRNPTQRSYRYKYEDELEFMIPFFKESTSGNCEDYSEYLEDDASSSLKMPSEVFVDGNTDYDRNQEVKPNISNYRTKNQDDSCSFNEPVYQELNPADPLDVFLITIGATLRKFSPYYLNQAKSNIFQVVQDYELKQIMNKDAQIPGSSDSNR
ncbi:uncharacterized protein [Epargyreus clarus]|uniref:uncharacterized protein isoform X1 n=1 Tax=Epargyreus clarus TaxID=520877 RepID=UPI003C2B969E